MDLDMMKNNVESALLELKTLQSYRHNPTVYVELAGNALYTPYMLNYAPVEKRFGHIIKRLERIPALFDQAKANLVDAPEVWNRVAREENDGNIGLIDKTLRDAAPESKKAAYGQAAEKALAAVRDFNAFLKDKLSAKTSDWRLGKEKYARKFALVLASGRTPEDLLAAAEADLKTVRAEMAKLAAPKTVEQALDDIARQHATPDTYIAKAKETLAQATAFVKEKDLLTLPARVQSAGDRDAGIHARHLRRRRIQPGAAARAAARRVLLDHADSEELAGRRGPNRSSASTTTTDCRS